MVSPKVFLNVIHFSGAELFFQQFVAGVGGFGHCGFSFLYYVSVLILPYCVVLFMLGVGGWGGGSVAYLLV